MCNILINEYTDLHSLLHFHKLTMPTDPTPTSINRTFVLLFLKNSDTLISDIFFKFYHILPVFLKVRTLLSRTTKESSTEKTLKKRQILKDGLGQKICKHILYFIMISCSSQSLLISTSPFQLIHLIH